MTDFHETRMGRTYYEITLPALVKQLERLNNALEQLAERLPAPPPASPAEPSDRE
jgi:hypothetical protein